MAMKTAAMSAAAAAAATSRSQGFGVGLGSGLGRLFSSSPFNFLPSQPQQQPDKPPQADPSPNVFVSGLSRRTTTDGLRDAFAKFGEVVHAKVVSDRVSGSSRGFGFVRYATTEEAKAGIMGMDGKFLDGWVIFAEFARQRLPSSPQSYESSAFATGQNGQY